jgi:YidC/Oxa1 family membrane protein insertase
MLPTEIQRVLLLIGLAATAYLMILAWNDDFIQQDVAADFGAAPEVTSDGSARIGGGPAPLADGVAVPDGGTEPLVPVDLPPAGAESDVPDASLIGEVGDQGAASAPSDADGDRLVKVTTPTLLVWIDRLGGDIVRVQLPRYPLTKDRPDVPYLLLDNGRGHTYIAQSGLIGAKGLESGGQRPLYRVVSPDLEVSGDGALEVVLKADLDGFEITKTFAFRGDSYLVELRQTLLNRSGSAVEAGLFAQIKRDGKEPYGEKSFTLGPQPYLGAALTTSESRYEKLDFEDLEEVDYRTTVEGGWIAFLQHYFLSAWIGNPEETNRYYGQARSDGTYIVGYTSPAKSVADGATGEWQSRFYAGPKKQKRLEEIAPNLNLTVDYGFLWWLAVPLFYILDWFHMFAGNWGFSIILLTVLVKLVLYPLSATSYRSMANMRRVGPQMKRLQERYADERQKLSQEMMNLYKKEGVNPLGGCLPMLLPMPIFIALYWVLFESVELRQAPFMLWIDDLSTMDPYFVLPLAMGVSMYVQQLLSPAVGDPLQVKMMRLMPIMFTVLFLFFPAGLVLYWLVNNVLSIAQQWWIMRQTEGNQAAKT